VELYSALAMAAALAAGAMVKGATGMGLPLIALPVLTSVFGLQHAIGVMIVPIIVTNAWQVWRLRPERHAESMGFLPMFLLAGVVGTILGTWLLTTLPERWLVLGLGIILLGYVALRVFKPRIVLSAPAAKRFGPLAGAGGGILQGATGISAPIGVTFIHSMSLERTAHVFAVSTMFLVYGLTQLPSMWLAGILKVEWLGQGVLALLPILVFMPVGQFLAAKLSRRAFDLLILAFLAVIGLKMVAGL
jgi:uncharacterized membrane protein YfcA